MNDNTNNGSHSGTGASGESTTNLTCGHPCAPPTPDGSHGHPNPHPSYQALVDLTQCVQDVGRAFDSVVKDHRESDTPRLVVAVDSTSGSIHYTMVGGAFCSYLRHWCTDSICYHLMDG